MENNNEVTIVDIKMPFMSIVTFMVKATIAAIPAFIILGIIILFLSNIDAFASSVITGYTNAANG